MRVTFRIRRGTSASWSTTNPVLDDGEPAVDRNTGDLKVGNGTNTWSELPSHPTMDTVQSAIDSAVATVVVPTGTTGMEKTGGGKEVVKAWGNVGGGTLTMDLALGNVHSAKLTADAAISFAGMTPSVACTSVLILESNGHVPTWPSGIIWDNATAPVISPVGKVDIFTFMSIDGGTTVYAWQAGQNMSPIRAAFAAVVLSMSPKYYLKADETSGTTLADATAAGRNGTAVGGVTRGVASLVPSNPTGKSVTLNGTTGYITNDANGVFSLTGQCTIMFTIKKPPGAIDEERIYVEGNNTLAPPYFSLCTGFPFGTSGTLLRQQFRNDANTTINAQNLATAVVADNVAHLVVYTYNNGVWKVYVDGALKASGSITPSGTMTLNNARWGVKSSAGVNSNYLPGSLDDLATFTTALTAQNVTDLYAAWAA